MTGILFSLKRDFSLVVLEFYSSHAHSNFVICSSYFRLTSLVIFKECKTRDLKYLFKLERHASISTRLFRAAKLAPEQRLC